MDPGCEDILIPISQEDITRLLLGDRNHFLITHVTPTAAKPHSQFLSGEHVAGLLRTMESFQEVVVLPALKGAAVRSFPGRRFTDVLEDLRTVFLDFDHVMSTISPEEYDRYRQGADAKIATRNADMSWT